MRGGEGGRETVGEERGAHSVKWALKLVKQKHLH